MFDTIRKRIYYYRIQHMGKWPKYAFILHEDYCIIHNEVMSRQGYNCDEIFMEKTKIMFGSKLTNGEIIFSEDTVS